MRKDFFYRCIVHDDKMVSALKTEGYVEADLGTHKSNDLWFVTHVPTGLSIPIGAKGRTAKTALSAAKEVILRTPKFEQLVQETMNTDKYKAFVKSRDEQTITFL